MSKLQVRPVGSAVNNNNNNNNNSRVVDNVNDNNNNSNKRVIFVCNDSQRWVDPFFAAVKPVAKKHDYTTIVLGIHALSEKDLKKGDILINFLNPTPTFLNDSDKLKHISSKGFVVINGSDKALYLDGGKLRQYEELDKHKVNVPKTYGIKDISNLSEKANKIYGTVGQNNPVVMKPNLGTEGKNVSMHKTASEALTALQKKGSLSTISSDKTVLIQENIRASTDPYVYRAEFVDGKLLYIAKIDASSGQSLCPCQLTKGNNKKSKISIVLDGQLPVSNSHMSDFKSKCCDFIRDNEIDACSFEFAVRNGQIYVYDVNILSTYNVDAEKSAGAQCPRGHEQYAKMVEQYLIA